MSIGKKLLAVTLLALNLLSVIAGEKINWQTKEFSAGRVSIEKGFFDFKQGLGIANFSPEFRMPLQLIYNSGNTKYGIVGRSWNIPQLESKFIPKVNGATWIAPWGQKIVFHAKPVHPKDKGKGNLLDCYCIESDYAAAQQRADVWTITGTKRNKGWTFEYRLGKLMKITAPSGRELTYKYDHKRRLQSVEQNGTAFVRLSYDAEYPLATSITVNGVYNRIAYSVVKTTTLMETTFENARIGRDPMLAGITKGNKILTQYKYDSAGYLAEVINGRNVKKFVVEHESISERRSYIAKVDQMKKGKMALSAIKRDHIAGRLLQDENFSYSYPSEGVIRLTNRAKQHAEYRFDSKLGILQVKNFAGEQRSYYYYRRYDVAYNGKLRKISDDDKKLDIVTYEYFPKSGLLKTAKHFNGITMSYKYDEQGNVLKVLRSVKGAKAQGLIACNYDKNGNKTLTSRLNADGSAYSSLKLDYGKFNQPEKISNDFNDQASRLSYNKFGYITKAGDGFNETTYDYGKYNRLTTSVNADGVKTTYKYNRYGALSRVIVSHEGKELAKQSFRYDRNGQLRSIKDAQGRKVSVRRDNDNRIVEKKLPNGTSIKYGYDKLGRLSFVEDQNKHKIQFAFNKFNKLSERITPSGQLSKWDYDKFGQIKSLTDSKGKNIDRQAKYTYNKLGQLTEVIYADGSWKSFTYNDLGKTKSITAVDSKGAKSSTTFKYDFFERVTSKTETVGNRKTEYVYTYNKADQRTAMQVKRGNGFVTDEKRTYDSFGRLVSIENNGNQSLSYEYNTRGRIIKQRANGADIVFDYDQLGRLKTKVLGSVQNPISKIEYFYGKDGQITAREVNGVKQEYAYDALGQLLSVTAGGKMLEQYKYDPAGNMLSKSVDGKVTTFKYDASNQLVSSTSDGKTTTYEYDAAGRMIQEGTTSYSYNFDNKVVKSGSNTYNYYASGQIANASYADGKKEDFTWDGLALLQRNSTNYLNEPYATGGNPVLANGKVLFNDMLGTTQGSISKNGKYQPTNTTAFGAGDKSTFFTGKPYVEGLGSVFLFRNYRPELSKWTSSDPLGYPDGWNNLAYGNNAVISGFDYQGTEWVLTSTSNTFATCPEPYHGAPVVGADYTTETDIYYTYTYTLAATDTQEVAGSWRTVIEYYNLVITTTTMVTTYNKTTGDIQDIDIDEDNSNGHPATVTNNYIWE